MRVFSSGLIRNGRFLCHACTPPLRRMSFTVYAHAQLFRVAHRAMPMHLDIGIIPAVQEIPAKGGHW